MNPFITAIIFQVKVPTTATNDGGEAVEVKVTVAQLPTTKDIDHMIQNGQGGNSIEKLWLEN